VKLIKCIVRPEKVDLLVEALSQVVPGVTVFEVRGRGRQRGHSAYYRGIEYEVTLLRKAALEMVVEDERVEVVLRVVMETARTGSVGDGRIFIHPVDEAYHVRTGFMQTE
jgi:nitrogen regulatory protein PII